MKNYSQIIHGKNYEYFFDKSYKHWTVIEVDSKGNQLGDSEDFSNKSQMLHFYNFNFTENKNF